MATHLTSRPAPVVRWAALALVVLAAAAMDGCSTTRNIVFERLYPRYRPPGERETDVFAAARQQGNVVQLVASGGNYYEFNTYYDAHNPTPTLYARWHAFPLYERPYLFEIFLVVTVHDFPPPGERREVPIDVVDLQYGEWRDRETFRAYPVEVESVVAWSIDERTPAVELVAKGEMPDEPADEEAGKWDINPYGGPGAPLVIERRKVWGIIAGELSEKVFLERLERFRKAGASEELGLE